MAVRTPYLGLCNKLDHLTAALEQAVEKGDESEAQGLLEPVLTAVLSKQESAIIQKMYGVGGISQRSAEEIGQVLEPRLSERAVAICAEYALFKVARHLQSVRGANDWPITVWERPPHVNVDQYHGIIWTGDLGLTPNTTIEQCRFSDPTYKVLVAAGIRWLSEFPCEWTPDCLINLPGFDLDNLNEVERMLYKHNSGLAMWKLTQKVPGIVQVTEYTKERTGSDPESPFVAMSVLFIPESDGISEQACAQNICECYRLDATDCDCMMAKNKFCRYYTRIETHASLEGHKVHYTKVKVPIPKG